MIMKRFIELRLKNVELPIGVVPEKPTNAVPVVRCKDCKYRFKNNGHSRDGCPIIDTNIWMDGDDFCSHGERKDNETD